MTSDAKIGLLLGLVFIFVIAFVINGLPSLRPPTASQADVTAIPGDVEGIAGKTTEAVSTWDAYQAQQRPGGETAAVAVEPPKPAGPETPQPSPLQPSQPQASQPPTANDEGIRFSLPLPATIGRILEQLPLVVPPSQGGTFSLDTPRPAPEQPATGGHPPVAMASSPRPEASSELKPAEMLTKVTDVVEPPRPAPVATKPALVPGSKSYTVVAGDNLPVISKKVYGPEEGNRLVNIDRIYQANLTVLRSPAEVYVGQKLVIPPPLPPLPKPATTTAAITTTTPAPNPNKPSDMLPKKLFEKVESLGRRAPAAVPPPTPEGRWYTVQEGDNLWKIAAGQLGAGSRWDEIHRLNAAILTSQDALKVGMRLRLPAK